MNTSAEYETVGKTLKGYLILLEGHDKVVILADKKNLTELLRSQVNLLKVNNSLSYARMI